MPTRQLALLLAVLGLALVLHSPALAADDDESDPLGVMRPVLGNQRLLVVFAKRPQDVGEPVDPFAIALRLFAPAGSMDAYFRRVSHGLVWFDLSTAQFVAGLPPLSVTDECRNDEVLAQTIPLIDPAVDFRNFDRLMILLKGNCRSMGEDEVLVATAEGPIRLSVAWIYDDWGSSMTIEHEMGHCFGFRHANSIQCEAVIDSTCIVHEYGDIYDVMGHSGNVNALYKTLAGWLPPANVVDVGAPGRYALASHNTAAAAGTAVQLLRVVRRTGNPLEIFTIANGQSVYGYAGWYYIEYRVPGPDDPPSVDAGAVQVRVAGEIARSHTLYLSSDDALRSVQEGEVRSGESLLLDGDVPLYLHVGEPDAATQRIDVRFERFALDVPETVPSTIGGLTVVRVRGVDLDGRVLHLTASGMPPGAMFVPLGDLDRSGAVGVNDIVRLGQLVNGAPAASEEEAALADVNGDGLVNGTDVALVQVPHANRHALLWRPDASQCGAYEVAFAIDAGGAPIERRTTIQPPDIVVRRPLLGESVHGLRALEVDTPCEAVTWSAGAQPQQPMARRGSSWQAVWDTRTVADGLQTVRVFSSGRLLRSFVMDVDNQPPLLHLRSATMRYYPTTVREDDRALVRGTFAIAGFDPAALPGGGGAWTFGFGAGFGADRVTVPALTCRSASRCEGRVEAIDPTGFRTSFDLGIARSGTQWKFTIRMLDEMIDLMPSGAPISMWLCPQNASIGSPTCLKAHLPFERSGNRLKYRAR